MATSQSPRFGIVHPAGAPMRIRADTIGQHHGMRAFTSWSLQQKGAKAASNKLCRQTPSILNGAWRRGRRLIGTSCPPSSCPLPPACDCSSTMRATAFSSLTLDSLRTPLKPHLPGGGLVSVPAVWSWPRPPTPCIDLPAWNHELVVCMIYRNVVSSLARRHKGSRSQASGG